MKHRFLPAPETPAYHLLLGAVAILILGPLGGITAAYMNFSLGFFVGGQVLAGILGSTVTYGYGAEGKQGANYMQTMAASIASMSGMAVLIQAMVWLNMPMPPAWQLMLFVGCIGMFGVGVGMLYTPILVDRLQLEYPSGHAVANILRALTDKRLLRRSVGKLGGGTALGIGLAALVEKVGFVGKTGISSSTVGAGLIVGSRIAVPGVVMAGIGALMVPWLRSIGWLGPQDPFRKIGFLIGLAMILGAAIVDLSLIGIETVRRVRQRQGAVASPEDRRQMRTGRLLIWVLFWGAMVVVVATQVLNQPVGYIVFAIMLTILFVCINGIACGISDSNPISSAFVVAVLLMSALGLKDPLVGMMAASILLISCTVGVDMQQDRSTGWRLGTNRVIQFRYQVVGIVVGSILCVVLATTFMAAYPVLKVDTFSHPEAKVGAWQSAMTFKFVGAIRDLGNLPVYKIKALAIGLVIGLVTEIARKVLRRRAGYKRFIDGSRAGFAVGWTMDAVLLSSPYASSFGGFVDVIPCIWFAVGGVVASLFNTLTAPKAAKRAAGAELPEDMSTMSLIGGGLIAGESLFMLGIGIVSLLTLLR